jgi:hypothetical protein
MPSNTLKRNGAWVVELLTPLHHQGRDIDEITISSPGFEHVIRWGMHEIPSTLALLSELTGLPEKLLRMITYPDVDRVMLAFTAMLPPAIQADFNKGARPFATPIDELPVEQLVNDQIDPRYPHVDGPVVRMPPTPAPALAVAKSDQPDDSGGLRAPLAETMRAVR